MALRIVGIYLLAGLFWIFCSDLLLDGIAQRLHLAASTTLMLQSINGFAYVMVTALLLYYYIKKLLAQDASKERAYRQLFEENPTAMYIFDRSTLQFLAVNAAGEKQYGYTRQEFLKLTSLQIRPEEDVQKWIDALKNNQQEGVWDGKIWRHKHKDGHIIPVHIYASDIYFLNTPAKLILALDVSEKMKAEEEARLQTSKMAAVLEQMNDGFFTVDKDWNFIFINKKFEELLQSDRTKMLGKHFLVDRPEAANSIFVREYKRAMDTQQKVEFEEYFPTIKCWLRVAAYPTPEALSVYFTDITKTKKFEERMVATNKQLREIAWVQSHKVRSPLANILGLVRLFNQDHKEDPFNGTVIEKITQESERLDGVIREVVRKTEEMEKS